MLAKYFSNTVYVKVYENRLVVKALDISQQPVTVRAAPPFSTSRLLVGQFKVAEAALKSAIKELFSSRMFSSSPVIVIQPMEKIEGGLSEVEHRVLQELAAAAGARKSVVWVGEALSDSEVRRHAGTD